MKEIRHNIESLFFYVICIPDDLDVEAVNSPKATSIQFAYHIFISLTNMELSPS
jgi:hypothetical protein